MRRGLVPAIAGFMLTATPLWGDDGYFVLVFAPETPVVLRLDVEFEEGVTIADNRRTYADRWFSRLDLDASGKLDSGEAVHVPSFGRFEDISGEMGQQWTRLDAEPTDGHLSQVELLEHVNAAMGSGLSIKRPRRSATQTVIILPRLDQDQDGQVSIPELLSGLSSLSPFDFDDDQSLSAAELQPFPRSMRSAASTLDTGTIPFVTLDDNTDFERVARRLVAQYGDETGIAAETMGLDERRFDELDSDSSGALSDQELSVFLQAPVADAQLRVQFPRRRLKRVQIGDIARPSAVQIDQESTRRRLASRIGGLSVDAQLLDAQASFDSITQQFRSRQFSIADRDRDNRLTQNEFGDLKIENVTFPAVDSDQDGSVTEDEFLAFVDLRSLLAQCRLEMTVANETTSLFEALDTDEDYRLSPREFEAGVDPLTSLDRNGNGKLAESELVTRYTLAFAVTRPPDFDDLVGTAGFSGMIDETRLPIVRPVTRGPEWFRKMDRNQDGDVTWREFLGPRSAFDRFDADGNGLIDGNEAETLPSSG